MSLGKEMCVACQRALTPMGQLLAEAQRHAAARSGDGSTFESSEDFDSASLKIAHWKLVGKQWFAVGTRIPREQLRDLTAGGFRRDAFAVAFNTACDFLLSRVDEQPYEELHDIQYFALIKGEQ